MAVKVAINGFGRIGRLVFRAMVEQGLVGKDVQVVAVGDIVPADNLAYLLKYDSTQGRFNGTVGSKKSAADKPEDDVLIVNGAEIKVVSAKTPAELPWKALGVDVVIAQFGVEQDPHIGACRRCGIAHEHQDLHRRCVRAACRVQNKT